MLAWAKHRRDRYSREAEAKLCASREFSRAATQIDSMHLYEFERSMYGSDETDKKQDACLAFLRQVTYSPAAKVARNADKAALSRLGVTATSITVGNFDIFTITYNQTQIEYVNGNILLMPNQRLNLSKLALPPLSGHLTRENVHHGKNTSGVHF